LIRRSVPGLPDTPLTMDGCLTLTAVSWTIVIRGLAGNCKKFGRPYCPCRIRSGNPEKDQDIVCPCVFHKDEVSTDGHCHCNLFYQSG